VAIVRLSGPRAEDFLRLFFRASSPTADFPLSHRLYHGRIESPGGELVDEVLAVIMRRPRSFTREDVVEVHCHGGPQVVRQILDLFLSAGARLAAPGEFTLRAFLNGRLDLAQAEAVIDVIRAGSEAASRLALRQLEGRLSREVRNFRERIVDLLALVEAHIDFPEEDIDPPHQGTLEAGAGDILAGIERLLATFEAGRTLREGIAVLIAGRPNVGKSSLLNSLLGESRAIVTEIPGTTRDTIEESLTLGGIPLRLVDTAGIRSTHDPVEAEGVRRARAKAAAADLVLLVLDGSQEPGEDDRLALEACQGTPTLLVINKADRPQIPLPPVFAAMPAVRISARSGTGMEELREKVVARVTGGRGGDRFDSVLVSDRRHREALLRAGEALRRFCSGTDTRQAPEFLALDLRQALQALGEITGETAAAEILDRIFSRFCIGK
jgi:tRNA modification GTPase